jgi:hypothetical protein
MQQEQELVTVSVSVPRERLGELYRLVAALNEGGPPGGPPGAAGAARPWGAGDEEVAGRLYDMVSPKARRILDELMALGDAGSIGGADLAAKAGLDNGAYGVAGSMSSVGKAAMKVGRELPYRATASDAEGGASVYGMEGHVSKLFRAAVAATGGPS